MRSMRAARPDDASILAEAQREIAKTPGRLASTPNELKDEAFRAAIVNAAIFLVAENEGVIVGHAFLERRELAVTSHVVNLTIAVHEGFQGMGYGKALLERLIEWARSDPTTEKIELHVRSSNERAVALYERAGFQEEGRKTKRLKLGPDRYVDDIYMALWVGQSEGAVASASADRDSCCR